MLRRSAGLGVALPGVAALRRNDGAGETSHCGAVAPPRLSALLALAVPTWAQTYEYRDTQIDPSDVPCQPALGCAAPRIHGELLKLGITISQATVAKPLRTAKRDRYWFRTFSEFLLGTDRGFVCIEYYRIGLAKIRGESAVNRRVAGSNPARGANPKSLVYLAFLDVSFR